MARLIYAGLLVLLAWPSWAAAASYTAYNTYLHPPFLQPEGGGLAAELVQALNRHLGNDQFVLQNVPRARFLAMTNRRPDKFDGIALFLTPAFVKGQLRPRYGWSEPLLGDEVNNLRKLLADRIDFTVVNRLHFRALSEASPELQHLQAVPEPGGDFLRHILLSPRLPHETAQNVAAAIRALQYDAEWQDALARYGAAPIRLTSG